MNGFILDIVLVILLFIFGLIGFYKGFLRGLLSLGGLFGSIVVTYYFHKPFVAVLNSVFGWGTNIANFVMKQIAQISPAFENDMANSVDELQNIIANSGSGEAYKLALKQIVKNADVSAEAPGTVASVAGGIISNFIMIIISFVVLFLAVKIVIFILDKILSAIPRKSAAGVVNKWLGLGLGLAKGALVVSVLVVGAYLLCLIPSVNDVVYPYIESSYGVKHVYNFLGNYILGVVK